MIVKNKQKTLRLPFDLYQKVEKEAAQRGLSVNAFVVSILWNYSLDQKKQ